MRLIDADAVVQEILTKCCTGCSIPEYNRCDGNCHVYDIKCFIEKATTISTGLTMHTRWEDCGVGGTVKCPICQFTDFFAKSERVELFRYCPGCGAKMKGGCENG